ncbi:MAG TPA: response regulator transcription factor [Thermoleophilaceae bacterium]|jgi:DNA-binding response OmpR family regulator|nr:response regulator transcription factor [Thermoleophilaceae bacterium]
MATASPRILVVDDEQPVQQLLDRTLRSEGYDVVPALDGEQALDEFDKQPFDLVMLDVMLPKLDGFEVCRRVRAQSSVPIIMLTAKAEEIADRVLGLELGADDYIIKTCSMRELRSRVKAVLRRARMSGADDQASDDPLVHNGLRIDPAKRSVERGGEPVKLTFFEFEILFALARQPGRVFTRVELLEHVLGDSEYRDQRTIDVHIRHLREKLEADPASPELILTERRVGYRFQET